MITTRTATLSMEKDGRALAASRIMLHSRAAGAYLEADLSTDEKVAVDDILQVVYNNGSGERMLVATVRIFTIPRSDSRNVVFASDLYRDRLKTIIPASAWRKAAVTEIAESVLADCDVDEYDISPLEGFKLPHFSCHDQNGWTVVRSLLRAVNEMERMRLFVLPSAEGVFRIGEYEDLTGGYESLELETENILTLGDDRLEAHIVGAVFGQEVLLDGRRLGRVKESVMSVSSGERRTRIWLEP